MTERSTPAKLRDVADAAGVSISTVSRVFSHPERLSPATVQHVKAVAAQLRFTPNVVARALKRGIAANIGLIVPDISNPYMTTLLKFSQGRSRASGVGVLVADTDDSAEIEFQVADQLSRQTRGLILAAPRMSAPRIRELAGRVPIVIINRVVEGVPSVVTDSSGALAEIIDHLRGLGHDHLMFLQGPVGSWANRQRLKAVTDRARASGMALTVIDGPAATYSDGIAAAPAVVAAGGTAVIAFDDVLASGLVQGLRREGLSVPEDISVVGHDDILAELVQPALTTVAAQGERVGRLAVERLLDLADGAAGDESTVAVHAAAVFRDSTGPAPR